MFLESMLYQIPNSNNPNRKHYLDMSYLDVKEKAFKNMLDEEFDKLLEEMIELEFIKFDKKIGKPYGRITVIEKGQRYYAEGMSKPKIGFI